ncbi:MAG: tetratricopeptide repeat protein [Planctomycetota bacterium]
MEILHGVLNNPEMADHAFFYFRDPTFIDRLPADQKKEDFLTEDDQSLQKLNRLKDDIRQQHREGKLKCEPRENYPDAKSLGERVLADFTALIDTLYPQGQEPSPLQRERMDHDAFARSRAGVYIGRQEYFDRLDAHIASDAPPLVVLGESGIGKSALLANWFLDRFPPSTTDPQPSTPFALLHFIGASPDSANATGLLRRIMLELKEQFDLPDEVPAQADKIREEFPNWLTKVAGEGRIVLVLDALNQLEDVDHAPDLGWLPRVFPKNCRVIISTLPGRSLTAIEQRGWLQSTPPLLVHPLDEPERRRLIHKFLTQYSRDLGSARTDLVASAPQTANPLYLRVLLNELRVFGRHEKLGERINWYLEARDPYELYRKVIARWEEVYSDGTNLVRDTLSLIWAARRGLSEAELTEALGQHDRPLPSAVWSPLHLAMSDALVTRSGLLTFAHNFLRTAVRDTYLPDEPQQQSAHRQLAKYFQQEPQTWSNRKLDELPWQLAKAQEWQSLHDTLTVQNCFLGLQRRDEYELLGYWLQLKPKFNLATSYTDAFDRWSRNLSNEAMLPIAASALAKFLYKAACHTAAESLMHRTLAIEEESRGAWHPEVAIQVSNLAVLFLNTNRFAEAVPLMRRALAIDEKHYGPFHPNITVRLNNLAQLLMETNRNMEAERLMRRALMIEEKSRGGSHPNVAIHLNNLAALLDATNRQAEAEPMMRRALAIDQESYGMDHPSVARDLNNLAQLLRDTDRMAEAEPLMRRALAIDETMSGNEHPDVARDLANLALLLQATNRAGDAERLMRRALFIDKQSYGSEHPNVARDLNNLACILQARGRLMEAEPLRRDALAIDERSYGPNHPNVAIELNNLAQLFQAMNRLNEAEPLLRRALAILSVSLGANHPKTVVSRDNLDILLRKMGGTGSHPYLECLIAKQQAIAMEDYLAAAKYRDELEQFNQSHEFGTDSLRLLEKLVVLRSVALSVKRAIGGNLRSAIDQSTLITVLSIGIDFVTEELDEFPDIQFQELCNELESITSPHDLFSILGLKRKAEQTGGGLGPDAWDEYAVHVNQRTDRLLYCLAQRFVQSPPTKDEAFVLALLFDHLGQPFAASALRDRFSTESDDSER